MPVVPPRLNTPGRAGPERFDSAAPTMDTNTDPTQPDAWRDDFEHQRDPETNEQYDEPCTVGFDLGDATYHARRHARILRERAALDKTRAELVAEITEWHAKADAKLAKRLAWHLTALTAYMQREHDENGTKTVDLPNGTRLERRTGKLSVVIEDPERAVEWCAANLTPALVPQPPKLAKAELLAQLSTKAADTTDAGQYPAITADGEIVPGLVIERGLPSFYVRPPAKLVDNEPDDVRPEPGDEP